MHGSRPRTHLAARRRAAADGAAARFVRLAAAATLLGAAVAVAACGTASGREVIVYTSVDQEFAEKALDRFEAQTGITVKAVYDVEAAKTTGLVNRLIAEKDRPLADVWWSGEFAQTVDLANKGILAPYVSPAAADIPAADKDAGGLWTGFGGRARVLIVNTDEVPVDQRPASIRDLVDSTVPADRIGLAHPVFGTAATQSAALYAAWGAAKAKTFYGDVAAHGVRIVDGNAVVRDLVASGELAWGVTDTDDGCGAVKKGAHVTLIFPDQAAGGLGTLVTPNTAGLIEGATHDAQAKALIDYLLSRDTEAALIADDWIQLSLRGVQGDSGCALPAGVQGMDVDLAAIAAHIDEAKTDMGAIFVR
ncbi:MAG: extracellular solute-binding protein [Ardenticatenales bacterium]